MSSSKGSENTPGTVQIRGIDCWLHEWKTDSSQPRAVVVLYHGFLAHGRYPTVRYAAELLAEHNYAVMAADMPGHGKSPGLRGYLPSADVLIRDGITIAQNAKNTYPDVPLFLIGSSMGGTIALSVAEDLGEMVSGVILLAPMLKINVAEPARYLLRGLSYLIPTLAVIPSSATSPEMQYRDPKKRQECEKDELSISGKHIRVASASTCVEMTHQLQAAFSKVQCPFLCMIGNEDVVVDNSGAFTLMHEAKTDYKTLKQYDALHGLLCEPSPLVDSIRTDILSWMNDRTT